jgi:hypothetical protein
MLGQVRSYVLPAMQKMGPVTAWIVIRNELHGRGELTGIEERITGSFER